MNWQFSLRRLLGLVTMVAVVCSLFATVEVFTAVMALAGMNFMAGCGFYLVERWLLCALAWATSALIVATFASFAVAVLRINGSLRLTWLLLTVACVLEFATIVCWLFSGSPSAAGKN
jgi:hypothetical protein